MKNVHLSSVSVHEVGNTLVELFCLHLASTANIHLHLNMLTEFNIFVRLMVSSCVLSCVTLLFNGGFHDEFGYCTMCMN